MADATGVVFVEETQITGLTASAWTTVSKPSIIPDNAKGIFGYFINTNATLNNNRKCGARHTGDTARSTLVDLRGADGSTWFAAGLDGSDQFQYYVENATDVELWVTGYFTGDVVFKTAAVDITPATSDSSWARDTDLTSDTSASATVAICQYYNSTIVRGYGAQSADDTADIIEDCGYDGSFFIVPMATGQLVDLAIELNGDGTGEMWLLGYMEGGLVDSTYSDQTPTSDSTWSTVTAPAVGAALGAAVVRQFDASGSNPDGIDKWQWREKDAAEYSFQPVDVSQGQFALVPLDCFADYQLYGTDPATDDTDMYQTMTLALGESPYPRIVDYDTGFVDTGNDPQSIPLTGVTVESGQLLMVILSVDGLSVSATWDQSTAGTWTAIWSDVDGNTINGNCYAKVADGTEDSKTLSIGINPADAVSWIILVIDNWSGNISDVEGTTFNQADSSPNPPSHTASWGSDTNLWIAGYHHDDAVDGVVTVWSLKRNRVQTTSTSNGGVTTAISTREYEAATFDPDTYNSTGSDQNISFTIAIRPVQAPAGATVNRVLTENTVVTDPVPGYQLTQERPANSNISLLTDAAFVYYTMARLAAETLSATDLYVMEQNLRRDLLDVATMSDAIDVLHLYFRDLSDSIAIEDDLTKSITIGEVGTTYSKTRRDNLAVSDTFDATFLGIYDKQKADSVAVAEAEFLSRFRNLSVADQIGIVSDLLNISKSKVTRDSIKASDALSIERLRITSVITLDKLLLTDSFERDLQYIKRKRITDSFALSDDTWFEQGSTLQPSVRIEVGIEER